MIWSNGLIVQYNWDSANSGTSITRSWRMPFKDSSYACCFCPTGNDSDTGGWDALQLVLCGGDGYYYGRSSTGYRLSQKASSPGYCVIAIGE